MRKQSFWIEFVDFKSFSKFIQLDEYWRKQLSNWNSVDNFACLHSNFNKNSVQTGCVKWPINRFKPV